MKRQRPQDKIVEHAVGMAGVEAQKAGSITFSPRCTILATLPHSDPGDIPIFVRRNGGYALSIEPGYNIRCDPPVCLGYPYGVLPRLILAWITAEAVRTKSRVLGLGDSVAGFLREINLEKGSGPRGNFTRVRNQMERLFASRITIHYEGEREGKGERKNERIHVVARDCLWWDPKRPEDEQSQHAIIVLGEQFYQEIIDRPVPLDMRVIQGLRRSSMALDIYSWLTYRMSYLKQETLIPWASLHLQFGGDYTRVRAFKAKFLEHLIDVKEIYPHARFSITDPKGLILFPSRPSVLPSPKTKKPKS